MNIKMKMFRIFPDLIFIISELVDALPKGVSAEEAEEIALKVDIKLGNLKAKVKGKDILDGKSQKYFVIALARTLANVINANARK